IGPLLSRHRKAWRRRTELAGRLAELEEVLTERDRRGTALREALERIEQSDPQPGEDYALRTQLEPLGNAEQLRAAASQAALALVGDERPAAGALVDVAAELAGRAARPDPTLASFVERVHASRIELSAPAAERFRYPARTDDSPRPLAASDAWLAAPTSVVRALAALLARAEGPAGDVTELLEASRSAAIDLVR